MRECSPLTTCHMSPGTCQMSHVKCHCHFHFCFRTKWLIGEGPVIIPHIIPKSSMLKRDDSDWNNNNKQTKIFYLPIFGFLASTGFCALLPDTLWPLQPLILHIAMSLFTSKGTRYFAFPGILPKQLL